MILEVSHAVRDASPPLTVVGLTIYGVQLPDIVSVVTLVYLVVHIGYIANKWYRERKNGR